MRDVVSYTDHFVICSGRNPRQAQAIADQIAEVLKRDRLMPRRVEGHRQGDWILLDYLDVVVHVQHSEERVYYALERLWKDCPRIQLPEPVGAAGPGPGGPTGPAGGDLR